MKASIIYYSATGNTETMADYIKEVLIDLDYDVNLKDVNDATLEDAEDNEILILGSPAMGVEEIEEYDFRPFFDDIGGSIENKKIILFGSYDWGDGEWLESWQDECIDLGANVIATFKSNLNPSDEDLDEIQSVLIDEL